MRSLVLLPRLEKAIALRAPFSSSCDAVHANKNINEELLFYILVSRMKIKLYN
ncbi:MAG: hypothetical protein RMY63_03345 [Nostoc sp. ChiQUE01b]|nr:hypothetical protein [Nostoc sp. ChiQUE01b]